MTHVASDPATVGDISISLTFASKKPLTPEEFWKVKEYLDKCSTILAEAVGRTSFELMPNPAEYKRLFKLTDV